MFSKRRRLARADFTAVLARGRRSSSKHFSIVASDQARGYAVVVSKKVARLSVTRHRLKRRTAAALDTLPLPNALIVFPRASATGLSPTELRAELATLTASRSR